MITKSQIMDQLETLKNDRLEYIDEMAVQYGDWLKELRNIKEHLDNPFATDFQMEMVRRAVDGLIATHLNAYKQLMK